MPTSSTSRSRCSRSAARSAPALLLVEASTSTHADAGIDSIVRDLQKLSLLAVPLGIRIAFKGLSWSRTVKDFAAAGDIVFRANCPNLGIAIDAFDMIAAGVPPDDDRRHRPRADLPRPAVRFHVAGNPDDRRAGDGRPALSRLSRRGRAQRGARESRHPARRDRLLRRLQLRRLQRRLPADAAGDRRGARAARGRLARRDGAAPRAAGAQHGTPAARHGAG